MTGKKLQRLLACLLAVLLLSQVGAFSPAVFAADDIDYTLHDGTAVIPAGTSADDVNRILAAALVDGFDQMTADEQQAILDKGFEYECEGKSVLFTNNTAWGSIGGFTSETGKYIKTTYSHPALADNKDGDYKVRLAGTTAEVTLTKAEKLSSSITLKQDASVKLPYKEDGTLDFDALRENIFSLVVESTTPKLTVNDVTIEYYSEATEVTAQMATTKDAIAVLPQPYVTAAGLQDETLRVALNLTEEWNKVADTQLITGVTVVRKEYAEEHPDVVAAFLTDYARSVEAANTDLDGTAALCEEQGVVAKAAIAKKALPNCNIVCLTGDELKADASAYLQVLFDADPAAVGGALPGDDFYWTAE